MELRFSLWLRCIKKNDVYGDLIYLSVTQYTKTKETHFFIQFIMN
jgi:hypothetical protein